MREAAGGNTRPESDQTSADDEGEHAGYEWVGE